MERRWTWSPRCSAAAHTRDARIPWPTSSRREKLHCCLWVYGPYRLNSLLFEYVRRGWACLLASLSQRLISHFMWWTNDSRSFPKRYMSSFPSGADTSFASNACGFCGPMHALIIYSVRAFRIRVCDFSADFHVLHGPSRTVPTPSPVEPFAHCTWMILFARLWCLRSAPVVSVQSSDLLLACLFAACSFSLTCERRPAEKKKKKIERRKTNWNKCESEWLVVIQWSLV